MDSMDAMLDSSTEVTFFYYVLTLICAIADALCVVVHALIRMCRLINAPGTSTRQLSEVAARIIGEILHSIRHPGQTNK